MTPTIDIWVDFTSQDDTGLPWTLLSEAADPARIVAGAFVIGGNPQAQAVVEVRSQHGLHLSLDDGLIRG